MKMLKRIKIAIKYDFASEFVVIPTGDTMQACRFLNYADAYEYAHKQSPVYYPANVFMAVNKKVRR